ncbi:NACHT domain-containing NTPase [Prevotella sp. HUN102]|uniref:NACHT domain-containing protein n=1 Tax=Prevotella sp. HUN102 TaxID=1392486 RepID=UPI0012DF7D3D|nr:hypothetical protein [Prevotella sp. HUN102]
MESSSRPEQALTSFGDFQRFFISPLNKKEAYELLRKYDKQGDTSKLLIDELKSGKYEMINEFLRNPLLVSLLFAAFDYKQTIPLKKHIFYRQVYDAYFDSHDLSKGDHYVHDKASKLDIDDFERILRYVGFKCLKFQKIEFEKDALLHIIDEAKQACPDLNFTSSDYLQDILTSVPLFCKDGQYLKWVHKSLQEYFAAQFIFKDSKSSQDTILKTLYNSDNIDRYLNLLDLYYDVDNWGFQKNILYPLCEDFVSFYQRTFYSSSVIREKSIQERIGHLYMRDVCILRIGNEERKDPFKYTKDRTEEILHGRMNTMTHFTSDDICIAQYFNPKKKILLLLNKRLPYLFNDYKDVNNPQSLDLEMNIVIEIDMNTGDSSLDCFKCYNYYLGAGHNEGNAYLDYNRCLDEIKKIKDIIKNKDKVSDLIDGL